MITEVLIEFGGVIGAPYGRDAYTRMGHIEIIDNRGINVGLNSNGATWSASSTIDFAPYSYVNSIGLSEPKNTFHHMENSGLKWYKCVLPNNVIGVESISFYVSSFSDGQTIHMGDYPQNISISLLENDEIVKTITETLIQPTVASALNKRIEINYNLHSQKLLLKSANKIYTLSELGEWQDLEITGTPSQVDFETHGMDDLSIIPKEKLDELTKPYSILTWTNKEDAAAIDLNYTYGEHETKWLYTNTSPFSPLDRLNEKDEFEIMTYSDEADEVPATTVSEEDTIDSGKLFTATLDDFDIVTGVEVK